MRKKWLIVKASGGGGLGDSIKSVLTAALYASLSNRILVVDWSGGVYSDGNDNPFYRLFSIKGIAAQAELPNSEDIFPDAWKGRLGKSLHEVYTEDGWQQWDRARTISQYSFDMTNRDYPNEVLVMWEFDQIHKLNENPLSAKPDILAMYRFAAGQYLRFSNEFDLRLDTLLANVKRPSIGVHVRATAEFDDNKGSLALEHYFNAVDDLLKPGLGLFLATDNIEIQTQFMNRYKHVYVKDKWFAEAGESLHMNTNCPDQFQNMMDAMLDIVLLSKCSTLVITPKSSFSEVAKIFADSSVEIVEPVRKRSFARNIISNLRRLIQKK